MRLLLVGFPDTTLSLLVGLREIETPRSWQVTLFRGKRGPPEKGLKLANASTRSLEETLPAPQYNPNLH